jgi:hypothetical protein
MHRHALLELQMIMRGRRESGLDSGQNRQLSYVNAPQGPGMPIGTVILSKEAIYARP